MLEIRFPDGETLYGSDIANSTIPEVYHQKLELVKISGINHEDAKLVTMFPFAFPLYTKYLGGAYVAS